MLEQIASSNAVQMTAVFGIGGLAYFLAARFPAIIAAVGFGVAAALTASFALDIGEVYSYADVYKRAFWYFGDDVTTWLTPIFVWAVISRRQALAIAVASAILFSGTRISLLLLLLQCASMLVIMKGERRDIVPGLVKPLAVGAVAYLCLATASPHMIAAGNNVAQVLTADSELVIFEPTRRGYNNCREGDCFGTRIARPLHDRSFSAVAGIWMTLEGGFPGSRYPNTAEKFADLMVEANPWGINDSLGVTRGEWHRIGAVQTAYLRFGSGYGMVLLAGLLVGITGLCVLGGKNILEGERGPFVAFTVFFIVNAIFNQSQPWLTRGPILAVMGFCAAHILAQYLWRRSAYRVGSSA